MREADRSQALSLLQVMSPSDYEPTGVLAKRAGLTTAAANRHLLRLCPAVVEWKSGSVISARRHRSVPVYLWRRKPGAIEKVRSA